jgi:hypothetical protein
MSASAGKSCERLAAGDRRPARSRRLTCLGDRSPSHIWLAVNRRCTHRVSYKLNTAHALKGVGSSEIPNCLKTRAVSTGRRLLNVDHRRIDMLLQRRDKEPVLGRTRQNRLARKSSNLHAVGALLTFGWTRAHVHNVSVRNDSAHQQQLTLKQALWRQHPVGAPIAHEVEKRNRAPAKRHDRVFRRWMAYSAYNLKGTNHKVGQEQQQPGFAILRVEAHGGSLSLLRLRTLPEKSGGLNWSRQRSNFALALVRPQQFSDYFCRPPPSHSQGLP